MYHNTLLAKFIPVELQVLQKKIEWHLMIMFGLAEKKFLTLIKLVTRREIGLGRLILISWD